MGKVQKLHKILQSPFTLHDALLNKIQLESENAEAGKPARIIFKVNSLIDNKIIKALYQASIAGVKVDLIVRGICGLRPGVAGISENIQVRSILGRFLEHTRVYYFENAGKPLVLSASADLMPRNLYRRVEVAFPFEDKSIRERVIKDMQNYLADNTNAWILNQDGSYERRTPGQEQPYTVQTDLLNELADS